MRLASDNASEQEDELPDVQDDDLTFDELMEAARAMNLHVMDDESFSHLDSLIIITVSDKIVPKFGRFLLAPPHFLDDHFST